MTNLNQSAISRRLLLGAAMAGVGALACPALAAPPAPPPYGRAAGALKVRGKRVEWVSETGETIMRNAAGVPRVTIFAVSYMARGSSKRRPVTFLWNGGPGGSTWHLREHLSPRITDTTPAAPGYRFVDNEHSIIDVSDLVFIDAPGTGFSRMGDTSTKPEYWGVEEDGRAFADFIIDWLTRHGRPDAPVYIVGESYGGTRAGQVARNLAERKIGLAGITLVAPTLAPLGGDYNWDESYSPAAMIPSMAAVAHHHGLGAYRADTADKVVADAIRYADGPYQAALDKGKALGGAERDAVAARISDYIGLPAARIAEANLVLPLEQYATGLLASRGLLLEVSDGRQTRPAPQPGETASVLTRDSGFDRTASIEALIRTELHYPAAGSYARDPMEISRSWNQATVREPRTDLILADLMRANRALRVFLVTGYYDLIVPFAPSKARLEAALPKDRFTSALYPAGHGVYEDMGLRPRTTADLAAFYKGGHA
ncbi:S10 family serine carboxypeptidase-like protein [Sphingopyxis sp.]|uniref:S10 family serine carboxypeptidase-like protein n=1 Tax=Sphingopyxis sp. TaxID=1908224 RepID=UPI002B4A3495|nr:hypothetical protein [Sphingopyxis sp.]HJS12958.1 hypothetical protein [Sphingopyxis sp.]